MATAARRTAARPFALVVSVGFYLLVVGILAAIWGAAAEGAGGSLEGYDATALLWYVTATEAAVVPLDLRLIERTGQDIADGDIVVDLLRPVPVLGLRVATELGASLPRLAVCLVGGGLFAVLVGGSAPPAAAVALALPALVLAMVCNLLAQYAFAGLSFWARDTRSGWFLYTKLVFLLGGMLIPIELLPPWLEPVARALPFVAMTYVPGRLLAGFPEPGLLLLQLGWLVALSLLAAGVFAAGERRLQVVGG
jgi:ABC-2 type transport system permease protein